MIKTVQRKIVNINKYFVLGIQFSSHTFVYIVYHDIESSSEQIIACIICFVFLTWYLFGMQKNYTLVKRSIWSFVLQVLIS